MAGTRPRRRLPPARRHPVPGRHAGGPRGTVPCVQRTAHRGEADRPRERSSPQSHSEPGRTARVAIRGRTRRGDGAAGPGDEGRGGGLIITRTNPKRIRETYDLASEKILWLTDREGSTEETIAPALERIVYELEDFMTKQASGAILIDGVEYLVSNNSFDAVLKFVRRLLDAVSESRYALIISIGPATVKEQELRVLEREMEVIRFP